MGEHDGYSRVGIWTACQRTDTLLAEVPHFHMPTQTESITASLASGTPKLTRNISGFAPLSPQVPGLASATTKKSLQWETTTVEVRRGSWQPACSLQE
jgi:hypothetical protein